MKSIQVAVIAFTLHLAAASHSSAAENDSRPSANEPPVVPLWTGEAPGSEGKTSEEQVDMQGGPRRRRVSNIHKPTLTVYLPAKDKSTGAAMIICPGGGHRFLSIDSEGYDVARWLAGQGIAGFVLKYRLAHEEGSSYTVHEHALADARRAVRLVRARSGDWGVDPARVGLMGFSAGGHLTILAGTRFEAGQAGAADPVDRFSSRPDFLGLIYPGYKDEKLEITAQTPPTFLAVADDDRLCAEISVEIYQALKKVQVSSELHIYARGGHGFGMAERPFPITKWNVRLAEWMVDRGYAKAAN